MQATKHARNRLQSKFFLKKYNLFQLSLKRNYHQQENNLYDDEYQQEPIN